jgi:hypothetical protein
MTRRRLIYRDIVLLDLWDLVWPFLGAGAFTNLVMGGILGASHAVRVSVWAVLSVLGLWVGITDIRKRHREKRLQESGQA